VDEVGSVITPPQWRIAGRVRPEVVILGAPNKPRVHEAIERLQGPIAERADLVAIDLEFAHDFVNCSHDLVIVVGGDGSILQAARQMGSNQLPVLGINCGRLGFLAALSPENFLKLWPRIAAGEYRVAESLMLECSVWRSGTCVARQAALNEAAVMGGPPYNILEIALEVDGQPASSYRCDGLIISTPVGSTAHNLSAGGPILQRTLPAVVISPLSPHTLTFRPVVDRADRIYELRVANPNASTSLVVDGRVQCRLEAGDRIRVERSAQSFRMVIVPGQNDYQTLREKLGWGGAVQQEPRTDD
jgi:NAD+ kinase